MGADGQGHIKLAPSGFETSGKPLTSSCRRSVTSLKSEGHRPDVSFGWG